MNPENLSLNSSNTSERNFKFNFEEGNRIWQEVISTSINTCYDDETFAAYTSREQMLAFFFTLFQSLTQYEDITKHNKMYDGRYFSAIKTTTYVFFKTNIDYGTSIGEIQPRTWWSRQYPQLLAIAILGISYLWSVDDSENKEQTDAGIDKIINWIYDIMQPNAIDSGIGVLQFLIELKQQHGRTK
jgi:hypothetical protein